ncbi:MAG: alpha-L-fucosidase, partial [Phycisphaerales bacterium]
MNTAPMLAALLALAAPVAAQPAAQPPAAVAPPAASAATERDQRMAWWRDARFGLFIHWGVYSVPAGEWNGQRCGGPSEWIMQSLKIPTSQYERFADRFNPVKYDPVQWAKVAKDAGVKYVVITSRHHDGFCLWDSKTSDWDVMRTPQPKDFLKPLADACRAEGIKFCLYYSILDWHHPDYQPRRAWNDLAKDHKTDFQGSFVPYVHAQVEEIIRGYQPAVLWFDGEWEETWAVKHGKDLERHVKSLKPDIIVNNRVGKSRDDMAGVNKPGVEIAGDFCTPEQEVPSTGLPGVDWESCMTMNDSWGFKNGDDHWKSSETLIRTLVDIASKGGNFLLNVGPTAQGEIPPPSIERLAAMGAWLKTNGDAIYGTRAGPFRKLPWGRCTAKGNTLFLHVFDWPADNVLPVPGLKTKIKGVRVLGSGPREFFIENNGGGGDTVTISLGGPAPDKIASVVAVE